MTHTILLPILVPLFLGCLLLFPLSVRLKRALLTSGTGALFLIALALLRQSASGELYYYAIGGWAQPFGISLMLDRLSAIMLTATALLSMFSVIYANRGDDEIGRFFHPLFAFQLLGINGAFLTADIFNLFVFFEILLIASFTLLLHGFGTARVRSGTHYVLLNLIGSTFFLIALGVIYGTAGTLSMADLSIKVASATQSQLLMYGAGGLLLVLVFGLKSALLPLYFWLPRAYASSSAPVAALFAIMTKVGIYAMLRVFTQIYGSTSGPLQDLIMRWLWPLALLTVLFGAIGLLAARYLKLQLGYLVIISAGTLQATIAMGTEAAIRGALFYLLHSTFVTAGFFLVADMISRERGEKRTELIAGPPLRHPRTLGAFFLVAAMGIAGIPPLSGFFGKATIMLAAATNTERLLLWSVLLISGLAAIIALSRAGTTLIWRTKGHPPTILPHGPGRIAATIALLAMSPALVIFAHPVLEFLGATAAQLLDVASYQAVITHTGGTP